MELYWSQVTTYMLIVMSISISSVSDIREIIKMVKFNKNFLMLLRAFHQKNLMQLQD